jgi:hypothetical protein
MSKLKMSKLKDRFAGRPAAVLGGGPSLPADMARLPKRSLLIAVNHHALRLCRPAYMVYNDEPATHPELQKAVQEHRVVLVSPEPTSDILFDVPVWTGFYSSNTAAWFALWLGCDPVLLCGMDLYQGDVKYFHSYDHDVPCFHYPLDQHLRPWVEDARASCPHPERLKAMSGPLGNVFGIYEPTLDN